MAEDRQPAGIGTETVRALATAGAKVIFSSRNLENGKNVAKEMQASGVKASSLFSMQHSSRLRILHVGSGLD